MTLTSLPLIFILISIIRIKSATNPDPEPKFDETFISQPYFIDKTLLLRDLFKNDGPDYNYLSYPPKFGKTLTLQMIKTFAQIEPVKGRVHLNWTETKSYQLFKHLKIARYRDVFENHMARYAVIHLNLKLDFPDPINDETVAKALNTVIRKCYTEYRWVIKITQKLIKNRYTSESVMEKALQGELDKVEIRESIQFLAQLLRDFFNAKVLLLIDDFDYFPNKAFVTGRKHIERYRKIVNLLIKKAFTYGNLQISHAIIFGTSSLNYNFSSYNYPGLGHYELGNWMFLSDNRFGPFMGFTEFDVEGLCRRYQCSNEEKSSLKLWYNGYLTRKSQLHEEDENKIKWIDFQPFGKQQISIYNPYSISRYFSHRSSANFSFKSYWPLSQDHKFIYNFLRVPEFRNKFVELFKYDGLEIPFDRDRIPKNFHQFTSLETVDDQTIELEEADNVLVGFFFDLGYLSYTKDLYYVARIPNYETQRTLFDILVEFYRKRSMPIDEIGDCFDQIIATNTWNETFHASSRVQEVLSKTFRIISKPNFYRGLSTDQAVEPVHRVLLPKGMEFHNIIFTAAWHTSLRRSNTVVNVTEIGDYRERDDILVHDRTNNHALIIRVRNQTNMEKTIPMGFRRGLKPKRNVTKIKFLIVKIDRKSEIETLVQVFN